MLSQSAHVYGVKNTCAKTNTVIMCCTQLWLYTGADAKYILKFLSNTILREDSAQLVQIYQSPIKLIQVQSFGIMYGTNYINKYLPKFLVGLQPIYINGEVWKPTGNCSCLSSGFSGPVAWKIGLHKD